MTWWCPYCDKEDTIMAHSGYDSAGDIITCPSCKKQSKLKDDEG